MTATEVKRPEVKTFTRRPQTTREADMACQMHTTITEFYGPQIGELQETLNTARAAFAQFEQEHGARKVELDQRLSTTMERLRTSVQVVEGALEHARTSQELDLIGMGMAYGSREGFRVGLLYALMLTPEAAMAGLKAMSCDAAADELVYKQLSGKDRLRNFAIEPASE